MLKIGSICLLLYASLSYGFEADIISSPIAPNAFHQTHVRGKLIAPNFVLVRPDQRLDGCKVTRCTFQGIGIIRLIFVGNMALLQLERNLDHYLGSLNELPDFSLVEKHHICQVLEQNGAGHIQEHACQLIEAELKQR
jgi:hypothetical protein